ncbi:MAG: GH3 auxin-responsive promoter family protein, partial [Parasporobacterium sp.]|nr:GH3 auxin-responsive promoter family protein [Parasporobacterium sp.]
MAGSLKNSIINIALNHKTNKHYREMAQACADPKESSAKTLRRILTDCKDTGYGVEHHFAQILESETADELFENYAKNVPVNSYDDLEPYISIMKHGGSNILIPDKPVIYLTTSGTTGEPKYLPFNQKTLDIGREILTMVLSGYAHINHSVFKGKVLAITGKAIEGTAPDGTPTGSTSGITRNAGGAMQKLLALPVSVFEIKDYQSRYYVIMRIAIEQDVSLMMTANPSSVLELQKTVDENFDAFCDEIEAGTLSEELDLTDEIRLDLMQAIKPNPQRAQELRKIKETVADNRPLPMDYWPNLRVLSTWKCGNTGFYAGKFKGWFPLQCQHIEVGYFASECRFGMVLRGGDTTVPFPHRYYFEFIAEEDFG